MTDDFIRLHRSRFQKEAIVRKGLKKVLIASLIVMGLLLILLVIVGYLVDRSILD